MEEGRKKKARRRMREGKDGSNWEDFKRQEKENNTEK
jgi:hypothetical protein